MSKQAHTPEERAALLAAVGAPAEAIEAEVEPAPEVVEKPKRTRKQKEDKTQTPTHEGLEHDVPTVVSAIVKQAGADKEAALDLCDKYAQGVFDSNKTSKVQAAARGIDSATHNRTLWTAVQNLRSALKKGVRDHYKGTIAAKVRTTSAVAEGKRDAEFEAFVSSDAMMTAFEAWKEAQKQG